jgi:aspartyl-tRNA(Asn)/glutamyl-tRNA(Gln) amidotransferase subunit C
MSVNRAEIKKIARLAKLSISESEIEQTATTLSDILTLIDRMQAVNTDGTEPLAHPLEAVQRLRADKVTESNQREKFQQNAPLTERGLYLVPRVIE